VLLFPVCMVYGVIRPHLGVEAVTGGAPLFAGEADALCSALSDIAEHLGHFLERAKAERPGVREGFLFKNAQAARRSVSIDVGAEKHELPVLGLSPLDEVAQFIQTVLPRRVFLAVGLEDDDDAAPNNRNSCSARLVTPECIGRR
jgi:hypothetical protein